MAPGEVLEIFHDKRLKSLVAADYGVSSSVVMDIQYKRTWKWVTAWCKREPPPANAVLLAWQRYGPPTKKRIPSSLATPERPNKWRLQQPTPHIKLGNGHRSPRSTR